MIEITGIDSTFATLNSINPKNAIDNALKLTAEKILELSEPKLPVKDGILKSSQTVIANSDGVLAGYNSEYASYQHEGRRMDGTRIIRNRPGGGESFFLSSTVIENKSQLLEFAKEQIKKQIK